MTAPLTADAANVQADVRFPAAKLMGLAIVTVIPTVFWTALLSFFAHVFGAELSTATVLATAAAILMFLTTIFAAMAAGSDHD